MKSQKYVKKEESEVSRATHYIIFGNLLKKISKMLGKQLKIYDVSAVTLVLGRKHSHLSI